MSIDRWIDKEIVVPKHNGIFLSHKKEHIWLSCNEVDEPRLYYTEWSQKNRGVQSQDGRGIGRETTFFPTKSLKEHLNTEKIHTHTHTKKLLNAGRGHQAPRKAVHYLWKEVWQNINGKKRDKRVRDGYPIPGGSRKRKVSKYQETLSLAGLWGVLESQKAT